MGEQTTADSTFQKIWADAQSAWLKTFEQMSRLGAGAFPQQPAGEGSGEPWQAWQKSFGEALEALGKFPAQVPLRTSMELLLSSANAFLKLQRSWFQGMENAPWSEMLKFQAQSLESMSRAWQELFSSLGSLQLPEPVRQLFAPLGAAGQQLLGNWGQMLLAMGGPGQQLLVPWLETWQKMFKEASATLARDGGRAALEQFQDSWTAAYRDTLGRLLGVPLVGPTRVTMEKVFKTIDTYYRYHGATIDFAFQVYQPAAVALEQVAEKARGLLAEGVTPEALRELYNLTLQVFEEAFLKLFKSEGFTRGMHLMLEHMLDFRKAYDDLCEAMLRETPIVTRSELDEVYAELHRLKRLVVKQVDVARTDEEGQS